MRSVVDGIQLKIAVRIEWCGVFYIVLNFGVRENGTRAVRKPEKKYETVGIW